MGSTGTASSVNNNQTKYDTLIKPNNPKFDILHDVDIILKAFEVKLVEDGIANKAAAKDIYYEYWFKLSGLVRKMTPEQSKSFELWLNNFKHSNHPEIMLEVADGVSKLNGENLGCFVIWLGFKNNQNAGPAEIQSAIKQASAGVRPKNLPTP
jgi:hypothetical protein